MASPALQYMQEGLQVSEDYEDGGLTRCLGYLLYEPGKFANARVDIC